MCVNNNCGGCNSCQPTICNQCPPTECECAVRISTDCVTYTGDDLACSSIPKNTILTDVIIQLDAFICQAIADLDAAINLINIGTGAEIYKGIDGIGRRELRKINPVGDLITVTQNTNDISVSIDENALGDFIEENQITYTCDSLGVIPTIGNEGFIYKETVNLIGDITEFRFRSIHNTDGTVEIIEEADTVLINSKTFIEEGDNVTVTGTGTPTDPFLISTTDPIIPPTLIEDGETTTVSGDGSLGNEYKIETKNLQKTINTFPYTLTNNDDKYTIFLANGIDNVVINVPDGLVSNFSCVFIQEGTGTITIQQSGTATLLYPSTTLQNIVKGQYYWAMVEKKLATNTYYLLGSLLPV